LYEEMTEKITNMPHALYPEHAEYFMLIWLAGWFGIENREMWDESRLRYLLLNQSRLSQMRGTRAYMEEMIRLYTGCSPYIVEYHQIIPYQESPESKRSMERLYGNSPYGVTVLLPEKAVEGHQMIAVLQHLIETAAPAGICCQLVILQSCIYLGQYSYIGVNSRLAGYAQLRLDDRSLLPYQSVIGRLRVPWEHPTYNRRICG
ncbi:MAG: hypothetical protein K2G89_11350, partial [Lachnospiraceae bacterium]|nr:hypothetical protein [Lachnospiraceae bacterium]